MITKVTGREILQFDLTDGETVQAMPVKEERDGTTYILVDCLKNETRMNKTDTTKGGYDASELRKKLNSDILARFPEEVREKMAPVYQDDLLTIPSKEEIFGENRWEPMKERRNRIAFQGHEGGWEWYWLRDPASRVAFIYVDPYGYHNYNYASSAYVGVRPVFKIRNL